MTTEPTITLEELAEHAPHPVKMLEHLIDHVEGLGERDWYQNDWIVTEFACLDLDEEIYRANTTSLASPEEFCGYAACVAGESVLFAGIEIKGRIESPQFIFQGRRVVTGNGYDPDWPAIADALGVSPYIEILGSAHGGRNLFHGYNNRDLILRELRHRHQLALEAEEQA